MRVLVTGGAGFIGSHLVDRLVAGGARVTVIDDLSRGRRDWLPVAVELVEADLRDEEGLAAAVGGAEPDVAVHLAALHFIPAVDAAPELAEGINVRGTENVLRALGERPVPLVFASTAAVYPIVNGPISESCEPGPVDLYGRTKLAGEELVRDYAQRTGADVAVVRLFNVIGPRETNPHVVPELVAQLRSNGARVRLGSLEPQRDYTDVRDVAAALGAIIALPSPNGVVLNVGSGRPVSVRDLVSTCEEILGRPIPIDVDPARVRPVDRPELVADASALRTATGWAPQYTLSQTLAELLAE